MAWSVSLHDAGSEHGESSRKASMDSIVATSPVCLACISVQILLQSLAVSASGRMPTKHMFTGDSRSSSLRRPAKHGRFPSLGDSAAYTTEAVRPTRHEGVFQCPGTPLYAVLLMSGGTSLSSVPVRLLRRPSTFRLLSRTGAKVVNVSIQEYRIWLIYERQIGFIWRAGASTRSVRRSRSPSYLLSCSS